MPQEWDNRWDTATSKSNNFGRTIFQNTTDGVPDAPACYVWGDCMSQAAVRHVPIPRQALAQRPSSVSAPADWRIKRIVVYHAYSCRNNSVWFLDLAFVVTTGRHCYRSRT